MIEFPDLEEDNNEDNSIAFTSEGIDFELDNPEKTVAWIKEVVERENCTLNYITYIFCSDDYLHKINVEHLNHDTLTDIITFPYADLPVIESDIYISIDRVRANAKNFEVSFEHELLRVLIHGVLHLCGHGDKTEEEAQNMRNKEEEAIDLFA